MTVSKRTLLAQDRDRSGARAAVLGTHLRRKPPRTGSPGSASADGQDDDGGRARELSDDRNPWFVRPKMYYPGEANGGKGRCGEQVTPVA